MAVSAAVACLICFAPALPAAAKEPPERLLVTDPYIDLRTGPGRGFPIFHVAERNTWVEVELRHTDWFKIRTEDGKEGWVERSQLENTLTDAGSRKTFRDVLLDDYLRRRLEMGAAWGHFKSEPMLKAWTSYNLSDTIAVEGTLGQVQGVFSGSDFWHLDLDVQPWSDRRLAPFFGVGFGRFKNFPNASLVGAIRTDARLANATIGVRYHIGERFIARLDWSTYTAFNSDRRTDEYRAWTAGLGFFF